MWSAALPDSIIIASGREPDLGPNLEPCSVRDRDEFYGYFACAGPFGFLINMLVYAALLWILFAGPFVLRRFLRVKHGLCDLIIIQ